MFAPPVPVMLLAMVQVLFAMPDSLLAVRPVRRVQAIHTRQELVMKHVLRVPVMLLALLKVFNALTRPSMYITMFAPPVPVMLLAMVQVLFAMPDSLLAVRSVRRVQAIHTRQELVMKHVLRVPVMLLAVLKVFNAMTLSSMYITTFAYPLPVMLLALV